MLRISKDMIKKMAIDEAVYYRGSRYYRENAVSNVTWSKANKQYRAMVKGSHDYQVSITVKEDHSLDYNCNCSAHVKYQGACKHVVATMLFIEDYQERSEAKQPESKEEKNVLQIIEYFNKQDDIEVYGDTFRIEVKITIPALLKGNLGKVFVSIQAGSNRLYKIQNLRKFLMDYANRETIVLGKEFKFFHGENHFYKNSAKVLDYLMEIFEVQEALGKVYYSNLFTKSELTITKNMFLRLLDCIGDDAFQLEFVDKVYDEVHFVKGKPEIELDLTVEEDNITVDYHKKESVIPITDNGSLLLVGNSLYLPEQDFIRNYLPFYNCLGKEKNPLRFQGENRQKFLEIVLPKIHETMSIDIPAQMRDKYIVEELKVKLYLDQYKTFIKAKVMFEYGDYEMNALISRVENGYIIVRQREKEKVFLDQLDEYNFIPYKDAFLLKNDDDIYQFITEGVEKLSSEAQLYYSDDFKGITIKQPGNLHTKIQLNENADLLELNFSYDDVSGSELRELFHSLQLKKKYHRLKNGSFINLDDYQIETTSNILNKLNLSGKNMLDNSFVLAKNAAPYLDYLLDENLDIQVEKHESFQNLVTEILEPKECKEPVPERINAQLRAYQITGFHWLKTLAAHHLGGILADDMGLGKTLQAIVYIASCPGKLHLIVCPTSLVYNWQDECTNFAPFLNTRVISGAPEERKKLLENLDGVDVIITSYPLIRRDSEHYKNCSFDTMFIDEAQFIKNANSLNAKSVKKIKAKHRFALTGTPIENSLSELWSIFDFIMPHYLQSHKKFVEDFEKPIIRDNNEKALEDLGKHIHPFLLRRMKKDVLTELPDKIETKLLTDLTEPQKKIYLSYIEQVRNEFKGHLSDGTFEKNRMQILASLTRLRQICCHPATFVNNYTGGSGKLDLLMEIMPNILANDHRILLFSQFTSMLQLIADELEKQQIKYFYLEGSTKILDRAEYVKRFNAGERSVFLISLKAGGTGLNLTGADTVIHYDPWWNPAVEDQATDRAYRIGQKNSVHVIRLISKGTIEEKIYKLQKRKKELSDSIIQSKEVFINTLTREELEDLFE